MRSDFRMKSALLGVLLSLAGGVALAQKPDKPVNNGQPPVSREAVKQEARQASRNTANTNVPAVSGEATTMTNHQPNMQPVPISDKTRAEVREQTYHRKPQCGETGEKTGIPTNPPGKMGTPQ